jgi:hypothetical protein
VLPRFARESRYFTRIKEEIFVQALLNLAGCKPPPLRLDLAFIRARLAVALAKAGHFAG